MVTAFAMKMEEILQLRLKAKKPEDVFFSSVSDEE